MNRFAAYQEQKGVTVAVSWKVALHTEGEYMPLLVNVVNEGRGAANVDLDNFSLIDEDGNRYHASSYSDVLSARGELPRDRRLARTFNYGDLDTRPVRMIPSYFYPYEGNVQDKDTELLTLSQMIDTVYFQVPKDVRKQKLTLVVEGIIDAPEFRVPFQIQ